MPRTTPLALALAAASLGAPALADDDRLTIYSGGYESLSQYADPGAGYALVQQRQAFDLQGGRQSVGVDALPLGIDIAAARLLPPEGAGVHGQRFEFGMPGGDALLERALGQTVTVEYAAGGSRERLTGTLVAVGQGLTLALPDGRVRVLRDYASFELRELPEGMATRSRLVWDVEGPRGRHDFTLEYPTTGLAWRAEYRVDLAAGGDCRMDFTGVAQVANRSGQGFSGRELVLVAGEPRRVVERAGGMERMAMADAMPAAVAAPPPPPPPPQRSGEYQAYTLPGAFRLPDGSLQQLPLMPPASGAACERIYLATTGAHGRRMSTPLTQPEIGGTGEFPVRVQLAFDNRSAAGLGRPLPAGRVRAFDDGGLLGESRLRHTAVNERVELDLGTVFDLRGERRTRDFSLNRSGRTMTETVEIQLRNGRDQALPVALLEGLPRWSDWEITDASHDWTQEDAQQVRFEVAVPAEGTTTVRYTVRYRWPADVRTP